jgi:Fe-S cluster biogenesis protein NfuA
LQDGGDVEFRKFEDGVVFVKMQGACSGCPSAPATLKRGIERMLMHWVPEVQGVTAVEADEVDKRESFNMLEERKRSMTNNF